MRKPTLINQASLGLVACFAGAVHAWAGGTPCEALAKMSLPHVEITSAALVQKGAFTPPPNPNVRAAPPAIAPTAANQGPGGAATPVGPGGNQNAVYKTTPAFCRVAATLRPTADSIINMEVWMPVEGWNNRLAETGNGGFGSNISYNELAAGVTQGYTMTNSDTGHQGDDDTFALGHPEKLVDWGYRAVHETSVTAKAVIAGYYGSKPKYSYWNACSTGGRQGWVAAEYYPNDFDGLVLGDPANPMTRLQAGNIGAYLALHKEPGSFIPMAKWAMIHKAVVDKCDALDGLKDGLVEDYLKCNFDPNSLLCKSGDADDCLTAPQLTALKYVVAGTKNPRTGELIYPGFPLGAPLQPGPVAADGHPDGSAPVVFRLLYQDPNFDFHIFNFDTDIARSDKLANHLMNAVEPAKLQAVFAHGGKILMYHGWNDPAITPLAGIQLYQQAVAANGGLGKTYNEIRLFMVPGMNHCSGGEGPNSFDKLAAISDWVENDKAPNQIIASHSTQGQVDRTRPLCPYPQIAKYKGSGSIDEAQNFICAAP